MNKTLYEKLLKKSNEYMETDRLYHDTSHIKNVLKNAMKLMEKVGGDEKIISDADKIDAFHITGLGRGFMMLSKKGLILKKAIEAYLELLEKWYSEFYFDESRKIVMEDYKRIKGLLNEMLNSY
jgi:hypothetical protein